ncbi:MAG: S8 family serine peptidase [Bacteroidales bacterium]|jgi:hypothetical protein|nr:S8 family serine peptidase [Bacteroidales bacterium]
MMKCVFLLVHSNGFLMFFYKTIFLWGICWLFPLCLAGQIRIAHDRYRIEFTDKAHSTYSIDHPEDFLSPRSLQRRAKQGIPVTPADLPVSRFYVDSLKRTGIEVLHVSRWFNSAVVRAGETDMERLKNMDFIGKSIFIPSETPKHEEDSVQMLLDLLNFLLKQKDTAGLSYGAPSEYYGKSAQQTGMLNGHILHQYGYSGHDMLIAVIDAGFYGADSLSGFAHLHGKGLPVRNFTDHKGIYGTDNHGANVLSIIAAKLPGQMIGSAPDADYVLLRSEETGSETMAEEDNWIAAIEYADSIGADLVSSSLGYSEFDTPEHNHVWADLNGRTARASRAAAMAAARGMIVCISAGNAGNKSWKYIAVPADADSILTVGAVDDRKNIAMFSSTGPTADGRIKPDVMAMGEKAAYQNSLGHIATGDGTSYSTPLLAGFVACLWQAFPEKTNMEIIGIVRQSSDRHSSPDSLYGYGIPDFAKALSVKYPLNGFVPYRISSIADASGVTVRLSPAKHGRTDIRIRTLSGHTVYHRTEYVHRHNAYEMSLSSKEVAFLPGTYLIEVRTDAGKAVEYFSFENQEISSPNE